MDIISVGKNRPITLSAGETLPKVKQTFSKVNGANLTGRLWKKDPAIWGESESIKESIKNSLGWLTIAEQMHTKVEVLKKFALDIKDQGYKNIVVLGMGGSSLAPEVFAKTFDGADGYPALQILDSTDPDAIAHIEEGIDPATTIFVVSSKSGSTIEPLCFFNHFFDLVSKVKGDDAGKNFIAITDAGSSLEALARERRFRTVFLNPKDIGGRFSALSYFGIVPAVLCGIDIDALLKDAILMAQENGPDTELEKNSPVFLGAALGGLSLTGRNKITFILSEDLLAFGLWLEQLIAESTGKHGMGIVPIVNEPTGEVRSYGKDRVFVHIGTGFLEEHEIELLHYLEAQGHPMISIRLNDLHELGGEFLRWEIATAVMGYVLGINPFDQPDVETAKRLTLSLLESVGLSSGGFQSGITLEGENFTLSMGDSTLERIHKRKTNYDLLGAVEDFFALLNDSDYIALLSYTDPNDTATNKLLRGLRFFLRERYKSATQLGYGPRYLHSTGQLHKGGADNGLFIIFLRPAPRQESTTITGKNYSFFDLESSQANGDLGALQARHRRVILINIQTTACAAIEEFYKLIEISTKPS